MSLSIDQVTVSWYNDKVRSGTPEYNEAVERVVRQAAADAGYDVVVIRSLVHNTTSMGARRDKPHITANFASSTRPGLNQTGHVNAGLYSTDSKGVGTWQRWQNNNRRTDYPYHKLYQKGGTSFKSRIETPAEAARREGRGGTTAQDTSADGWYPDKDYPGHERYFQSGNWTESRRKVSGATSSEASRGAAHYADGWYEDHEYPGYERYFQGGLWTESRRKIDESASSGASGGGGTSAHYVDGWYDDSANLEYQR